MRRHALSAPTVGIAQIAEVAQHDDRHVRHRQVKAEHDADDHHQDGDEKTTHLAKIAQQQVIHLTAHEAAAPPHRVGDRQKDGSQGDQQVLPAANLIIERIDELCHRQPADEKQDETDQPCAADGRRFIPEMPRQQPDADRQHHHRHNDCTPAESI